MDLTEESSDVLRLDCLDLVHRYTQLRKEKKTYHNTFKLYYTHQYTRQEYHRLMYKNAVYIMTQLGLSEQGKVL